MRPCRIHFTKFKNRADYIIFCEDIKSRADVIINKHFGRTNRVKIVDNQWRADVILFQSNRRSNAHLKVYLIPESSNHTFNFAQKSDFKKYFCP